LCTTAIRALSRAPAATYSTRVIAHSVNAIRVFINKPNRETIVLVRTIRAPAAKESGHKSQ